MEQARNETVSEAQEVFTRTCADWLNVIGQLARTTTGNAHAWADNFASALADYIAAGTALVVAGEIPGDQLEGFCDTEVWRDLAIAVATEPTEDEESPHVLAAVRTLHLAYEYHNAEEERRMATPIAIESAAAFDRAKRAREERIQ